MERISFVELVAAFSIGALFVLASILASRVSVQVVENAPTKEVRQVVTTSQTAFDKLREAFR
jgi:mannose/fructose/N-acetylgalactosamine-specific phosphotransferase system component IID